MSRRDLFQILMKGGLGGNDVIQTLLKVIICFRHCLHPFWDILGPSWATSGLCWSNADAILTHLRPIYLILGLSWDPFGQVWAYLGPLGAILGASWDRELSS